MTPGLPTAIRRMPLGILLIAAGLAIGGLGLLIGGAYLLFREGSLSTWAGAVSIVASPAILYFVYHLVQFARWTWLGLAVLLGLLFASSLLRVAFTPGIPTAGLIEIVLEILTAVYISRPTVRARYGWPVEGV